MSKRLRNIYCGMLRRCNNPKDTGFKHYGVKKVPEEQFTEFLKRGSNEKS